MKLHTQSVITGVIVALGLVWIGWQEADHCDNYPHTQHKCDCNRATKCKKDRPEGEDVHCKSYCKKDACGCVDPCSRGT